jgi:hypothetical protein
MAETVFTCSGGDGPAHGRQQQASTPRHSRPNVFIFLVGRDVHGINGSIDCGPPPMGFLPL